MKTGKNHILVINCGSSSLKYEIFAMSGVEDSPKSHSICKGIVERIGSKEAVLLHKSKIESESEYISIKKTIAIEDHVQACNTVVRLLTSSEVGGIITDIQSIDAVGHRVVHGGEYYNSSVIIDAQVEKNIAQLAPFAPLHNPANLNGIHAVQSIFSHCPHTAVFDTAFHQTMPPHAYMYALPYEIYKKYGIRRYGFHGTSHYYVSREAARRMGKEPKDINVITCHLGNGCSISAVEKGISIETSMGFTPLQGMMMGTRSGDIDPAILGYLQSQGMSFTELDTMMNKQSGLLGISGVSNDMRDLQEAMKQGNKRAELALQMFAWSVQKHVGAYVGLLHTVDMLIFTAGVGQNDVEMRERICEPFYNLGISLDKEKNRSVGKGEGIISADFSPVPIAVIETREELQIALDTYKLICKS